MKYLHTDNKASCFYTLYGITLYKHFYFVLFFDNHFTMRWMHWGERLESQIGPSLILSPTVLLQWHTYFYSMKITQEQMLQCFTD